MDLEFTIGPAAAKIYLESTSKNSVYLDKLRSIIERLIDENDVTIEIKNGEAYDMRHPALSKWTWMQSNGLPEKSTIAASLDKPEEMKKIQAELKAVIKKGMSEYGLGSWFANCLNKPYLFYVLKEAKEFMTTEDFTVAMSFASQFGHFAGEFRAENGFSKDDFMELLKGCDTKLFRVFHPEAFGAVDVFSGQSADSEVTVYLDDMEYDGKPDLSLVFSWFSSPTQLIDYCLGFDGKEGLIGHGVYTAKIKVKDIFGCLSAREYNVILNPDKLYDIEYIDEITEWDEYGADEWEDEDEE